MAIGRFCFVAGADADDVDVKVDVIDMMVDVMMADVVAHVHKLCIAAGLRQGQRIFSLIEDVKDIVQPRHGVQEYTILKQVLAVETWQQMKVGWQVLGSEG